MNASNSTLRRTLRGLGYVAILLTIFEACSSNDASTPLPPGGPATVAIAGIALGQGFVSDGDDASSKLACDYTIGVNVTLTFWTLYGPGKCSGALQCGQLRVSLLGGSDDHEWLTVTAAGNGVALDVRLATSPLPVGSDSYRVRVELVDDSGKPYVAVDGGNGSAEQQFVMTVPSAEDCARMSGEAGASGGLAGASNTAGDGGSTAGGGDSAAGGDSPGGSGGTAGGGGTGGGTAGGGGDGPGGGGTGGGTAGGGGDGPGGGGTGGNGATGG